MFEQAMLSHPRKPWTLGASLTLQCAIVGSLVLYSAIHVDTLPLISMRHLELPMPAAPKPVVLVPIPNGVHRSGSLTVGPKPFIAPSHIPTSIVMTDDGESETPVLANQLGSTIGSSFIGILGMLPSSHAMPVAPQPVAVAVQPKAATTPLRLGGLVMEAKIVKRVLPLYPTLAKNMRISGKVHLMSIIAKDGTVQKLELIDGHPLLVQAAMDAVRQWVYRPTTLNGDPVDVIAPIEVNFILK